MLAPSGWMERVLIGQKINVLKKINFYRVFLVQRVLLSVYSRLQVVWLVCFLKRLKEADFLEQNY